MTQDSESPPVSPASVTDSAVSPAPSAGPLGFPSPPDRLTQGLLWLALGLAIVMQWVHLGLPALDSPHEARVIATGQRMAANDQYVVPYFNDSLRLQKPPLPYWSIALMCKLTHPGDLPISEALARLPSTLMGILGILLTGWVARILFDRPTALVAALLQGLTLKYVTESRLARVDIYLSFWVMVALLLLALVLFAEKRRDWLWLLVWAAMGMGFLAKWVNVLMYLLPPMILGLIALPQRRPRWRWLVGGVILFFLIGFSWEVLLAHHLGWDTVVAGWQREVRDNVTSPEHRANHGMFYYPAQVFLLAFPWCAAMPIGLTLPCWRQFKGRRIPLWWTAVLFLVPLLILSLVSKKKIDYLVPGLPALAILGAKAWLMALEDLESQAGRPKLRCPLGQVQAILFMAAGVGALITCGFETQQRYLFIIFCGLSLLIAGGVSFWLFGRGRGWWALAALYLGMAIFGNVLVGGFLASDKQITSASLARQLHLIAKDGPWGYFRQSDDALVYHLNQPIEILGDVNDLKAFAQKAPQGFVLVQAPSLAEAQTIAPDVVLHDPHFRHEPIPLLDDSDGGIDLYLLSVAPYRGPLYEPSEDDTTWITHASHPAVTGAQKALDQLENFIADQPDGDSFIMVHDQKVYRVTPLDSNAVLTDSHFQDRAVAIRQEPNQPALYLLSQRDYQKMTYDIVEILWIGFGFLAQSMFFGRFLIQWLESEKKRASVIPIGFWWLSLAGGLMLLVYAIHRRDPVFIVGQATGVFIYLRNLYFIYARPRPMEAVSPPEEPDMDAEAPSQDLGL